MAAGDYAGRTGVITDDEIGALSESFDRMAGAVEAQVDRLNAALTRERDFVAAFTHELKTPMTSMMGYAALLRRGPQDPPPPRPRPPTSSTTRPAGWRRWAASCWPCWSWTPRRASPPPRSPTPPCSAHWSAPFARRDPGAGLRFEPAGCRVAVDRTLWEDLLRNLIRNALTACRGAGRAPASRWAAGPKGTGRCSRWPTPAAASRRRICPG